MEILNLNYQRREIPLAFVGFHDLIRVTCTAALLFTIVIHQNIYIKRIKLIQFFSIEQQNKKIFHSRQVVKYLNIVRVEKCEIQGAINIRTERRLCSINIKELDINDLSRISPSESEHIGS